MDTDDICAENRLEIQLRAFQKTPDAILIGGQICEFTGTTSCINSTRKVPCTHKDIFKFARKRNPFNHMTVMFRKSAILEVGSYEHMPYFEDYYLWIKLLSHEKIVMNVEETLVFARADETMYQRRGGIQYIKHLVQFQNSIFKLGFISKKEFLINCAIRVIVGIIPVNLRIKFYNKHLRA
jgi:hypothetical protein